MCVRRLADLREVCAKTGEIVNIDLSVCARVFVRTCDLFVFSLFKPSAGEFSTF